MKKYILSGLCMVAAIGGLMFRSRIRDVYIESTKPIVPSEQPRPTMSLKPTVSTPTISLPPVSGFNLAVPFSSQAPRGDWSLPWQEACEETSALLVDAYWREVAPSVDQVEQGIQRLVQWQQATFGYYKHTTAAQTARMIREVYGYRRVDVLYDVDTNDIAEHIRAGRPVIVPMAGRKLGNTYYTSPGPVYHMLVVKGIAVNGDIITNDVGTRHGRNLAYTPKVFLSAMHDVPAGGDDWPIGVDPVPYVESGRSAIIVIYPNN